MRVRRPQLSPARVGAGLLVSASLLCLGCESFLNDYQLASPQEDAGAGSQTAQNTAHLCEIENAHFVLELDLSSDEKEPDLESYYERANPEFISHLQQMGNAYEANSPYRHITYLMGSAGVGKSFVTRNSLHVFEDSEQCTVLMKDLFIRSSDLGFETELRPDLATVDQQLTFNQLLAHSGALSIQDLLRAGSCYDENEQLNPSVVIDGLDEVHDDSARHVLKALDEFVRDGAAGAGPFIHFLVAARPEGFASWLSDPSRTERHQANVTTFDLVAPAYVTLGDLDFRLSGYLEFTDQLEDYAETVEYQRYLSSFSGAVAKYPFLGYSIGNLAVGNVVIEHTAPELAESDQQLKAGLFDDIIFRNSQSHGRPGAGAKLESAYLRVLEDIAARYADVSASGVFSVRSEDSVEVFDDDGVSLGEVRVRNVLNRAGIAFLISARTTTTRYRFDPFWIHGHLIERRNRRLDPDYEYRSCN